MKKVLILEDEVSIRSFVVINLNRAGYEVIEAGTGMEALEKLKDIDLVAYVRFASVYRDFKDIDSFMSELKALQIKK